MKFSEKKLKQFRFGKVTVQVSLLVALVGLSACSTLEEIGESAKIDYRSAGRRTNLEVPPDLTAPGAVDRGSSASEFAKQAGERNQGATVAVVLPNAPGVKIERANGQRWLVVDLPPDAVWKSLVDFWPDNGFKLLTVSPQTGIMETDWAENRAKIPNDGIRSVLGKALDSLYSTAERDKFRLRIDASSNGSEIYISHRGIQEVSVGQLKDNTRWEQRGTGSDPELEAEFLRRVALRLGADKTRAEQVAAAAKAPTNVASTTAAAPSSVPAATKVKMQGTGPTAQLELAEDGFDRSWRRVGIALEKVGFTVEDRDRSKGHYFVRYLDPELEAKSGRGSGVLSRLFSSDADLKAKTYRVTVAQKGSIANIAVANQNGSVITDATDSQVAARILTLLQDQLK
jgi:outer membrane protein assembly factor BamC